ncbi:MAG: hypothetical protein AAGJ12_07900 [Bacteroidota bacterium]
MKHFALPLLLLTILLNACSSNDDDVQDESDILGTYRLTGFNLDTDETTPELQLITVVYESLLANDCDFLNWRFEADGTFVALTTLVAIEGVFTDNGTVQCPEGLTQEVQGSWSFIDGNLLVSNADMPSDVMIEVSGKKLIVKGEDLDPESLSGIILEFTKQN